MTSFSLAHFPLEVLGSIFNHESSSFLLLQVWKTGDSMLRQKLVQAVTKVDLRQQAEYLCFFPSILLEFRNLRSLSLATHECIVENQADFKAKLNSLSKSLESLVIRSEDSEAFLFDKDNDRYQYSHLLNFHTEMLPNLYSLSLGSLDSELPALQVPSFPSLPPTLTYFNISAIYDGHGWSRFLAALPRALRVLDAKLTVKIDAIIDPSAAPPNLERIASIELIGVNGKDGSPDTLEWLPRSLTHARLTFLLKSLWTLEHARSLPPLFESLTLAKVDLASFSRVPYWVALLPKSLTRLEFDAREFSDDHVDPLLTAADIDLLPRTIKTLKSFSSELFDWNSLRTASQLNWPPHLTKLGFRPGSSSKLLPGDIGLLPRTVLHLEIIELSIDNATLVDGFAYLDGKLLPPRLQTLTAVGLMADVCLKASTDPEFKLPSTLTDLSFLCHADTTWLGWEDRNRAAARNWTCLPDSLTQLRWRTALDPTADFSALALAKCLIKLKVGEWQDTNLKDLPRTLQRLHIDAFTRTLSKPDSWSLLEHLPSALTSIKIFRYITSKDKINEDFPYSPTSFSHLSQLKTLSINLLCCFTSEVLVHLPRSLRSLDIRLNAITEKDLPNIPPKLRVMNLGHSLDPKLPSLCQYWPLRAIKSIPWGKWELHSNTANRILPEHASEL